LGLSSVWDIKKGKSSIDFTSMGTLYLTAQIFSNREDSGPRSQTLQCTSNIKNELVKY